MLFLRSLINFFFVPTIGLVLLNAKTYKDMKLSFGVFLEYAMLVAVNIPITRVFTYFGRVLTTMDIEADSSYYTICAIAGVAVISYSVILYRQIRKNNSVEQ